MGWLIGPTLVSFIAAYLVVKLFNYAFSEATGGLVGAARAGLFVGTWTAVTARSGMRGFNRRVRQLRQGNQGALKALSKGERP